jgi:hypothetical protein
MSGRLTAVRVLGGVLLFALAGCGTTVPQQRVGAGPLGDGLGSSGSATTASGPPGTAPTTGVFATAAGGAVNTGQGAGAGPVVEGGSGTIDDGGTASSNGGRKLPPIEIGTYYLEGGTEAVAAAGATGLVIPDNKPLFDAMVKYLNAHGGLGGRQIKPVAFKYVQGGDPQAQDAAACAAFTQDHHVYLVLGGINSGAGQLPACLTKHGVPLIGGNFGGDARYFATTHRFIYEPGQVNFTLGLSVLVSDLKSQGFFDGADVKIGLVQYTGATYDHAIDDGLIPSLARIGLKLTDRVKTEGTDNAVIASASANAVLKFRSEGVNRVVFMAPGGAAALYFMNAASSQQYKPRYGLWSPDSPYVVAVAAAKDQLANAVGIGYQPGLDVGSAQDPTATTPVAKACLAFWDSLGQSDSSGLNNPLKRAMCDGFTTLRRAVAHSADTLTSTAALEAGYDALGSSYAPASTFAMRFASGGHDAANGYRRFLYRNDCSCFVYTGVTRKLR